MIENILNFLNRKGVLLTIAGVAIILTVGLILFDYFSPFVLSGWNLGERTKREIAEKVINFIKDNELTTQEVTLADISQVSGVLKIKLKIGNSEYDTYATKDGKLFFPEGFDMTRSLFENDEEKTTPKEKKEVQKRDNPQLEAYIASQCPFGLQMQRALLELIKEVPEVEKYIKVRYMGSVSADGKVFAMHGEEEATEHLRQICIREEQPAKYWPYVGCYIKAGKGTECEKEVGVDSEKLKSCVSASSRGIAYAKKDFDLNEKYNVTGSPTMILNEVEVSEYQYGGRNPEGLKSLLCAGFSSEPAFCSKKLNKTDAAPGYSPTYSR